MKFSTSTVLTGETQPTIIWGISQSAAEGAMLNWLTENADGPHLMEDEIIWGYEPIHPPALALYRRPQMAP
jgi:hypothetical protein